MIMTNTKVLKSLIDTLTSDVAKIIYEFGIYGSNIADCFLESTNEEDLCILFLYSLINESLNFIEQIEEKNGNIAQEFMSLQPWTMGENFLNEDEQQIQNTFYASVQSSYY